MKDLTTARRNLFEVRRKIRAKRQAMIKIWEDLEHLTKLEASLEAERRQLVHRLEHAPRHSQNKPQPRQAALNG